MITKLVFERSGNTNGYTATLYEDGIATKYVTHEDIAPQPFMVFIEVALKSFRSYLA